MKPRPSLSSSIRAVLALLIPVILAAPLGVNAAVKKAASRDGGAMPQRVVSLAPSVTETLFALGLGDRVVGVTRYCDYPPEATRKPKVGGYYDPNYEAILSLKPDLVIVLAANEDHKSKFEALGLDALEVDNERVEGILNSILKIGERLGAEDKAEALVRGIKSRMGKLAKDVNGGRKPKILISVGRNMGTGSISDVYIAGEKTFYDDLISLAGGVNAYRGASLAYPAVSAEGIIRMKPDLIIDMVPDIEKEGWDEGDIVKEWESVLGVEALNETRVHVIGDKYAVIPGPRFILTLERISKLLNNTEAWK